MEEKEGVEGVGGWLLVWLSVEVEEKWFLKHSANDMASLQVNSEVGTVRHGARELGVPDVSDTTSET